MANVFVNKKVDLTTTDLTTLYTVPSFKSSIIKSLLVSEDAGSGSTITVTLVNSSGTQKIDTRARAREISLKIENTSTGQFWKLGTFRIDYQPDGRR